MRTAWCGKAYRDARSSALERSQVQIRCSETLLVVPSQETKMRISVHFQARQRHGAHSVERVVRLARQRRRGRGRGRQLDSLLATSRGASSPRSLRSSKMEDSSRRTSGALVARIARGARRSTNPQQQTHTGNATRIVRHVRGQTLHTPPNSELTPEFTSSRYSSGAMRALRREKQNKPKLESRSVTPVVSLPRCCPQGGARVEKTRRCSYWRHLIKSL